jgi:hypothetical protein
VLVIDQFKNKLAEPALGLFLSGRCFYFRSDPKPFDELGSANMEAPRVSVIGKTYRNRDRLTSPLRVHKNEHSVTYCPDVIFTQSHRLQFQDFARHKALIVASVKSSL